MSSNSYRYRAAVHDFQAAQQRAAVQEVLARVTGKSAQLLSYDEVAEKLKLHVRTEHGAMDFLKQTAEEKCADLVLMGSHGGTLLNQVLVGSALDYMLRESRVPIFICR